MSLTPSQNEAVQARGNVVVVAGAGTGKTSTLVARCLHCLVNAVPPASLNEILIVTFTEAAAAEIRQRIRARLEEESRLHPEQPRWQEELALFENAHIGTLHGFCLQLVRQHFYELELDPQLTVLSEEEAHLLAEETLSAIFEKHYIGNTDIAEPVQKLIQAQGGGSDKPIRRLVLQVHHYTQTLPDPGRWFDQQRENFAKPRPDLWRRWLLEGLARWRAQWLPVVEANSNRHPVIRECAAILAALEREPDLSQGATALRQVAAATEGWLDSKTRGAADPFTEFVRESEFLASVAIMTGDTNPIDPLEQDWAWVHPQMLILLQLAQDFSQTFADTKRELGVVDFHDLEQHALRLLRDPQTREPTDIALQWQQRLRFVYVDEYQDINAAQDQIIAALSRSGPQANRFLVGDVKQSIYRFRLANPRIFRRYVDSWGGNSSSPEGQVIPLVENFRSREGLLDFVNALFGSIMREELGGVGYGGQARLKFGAPTERKPLSVAADSNPCVELHVRLKPKTSRSAPDLEGSEIMAELLGMAETEKEARAMAMRLGNLRNQAFPVWDEERRACRPVDWEDMAVLLRSPANKSESYAKEFSRLNIPLLVERSAFYEAMEISDLLSLLRILDNPLQDLPLLAVLHSPLVGLTANELAEVRLAGRGTFWSTLVKWAAGGEASETRRKVRGFLDRFYQWRRMARQASLSRCLDTILSQTYYATWLLTQPRGEQRYANVQRLLALAHQFDRFRRQGLFRFLCFVEAQQLAETEPEVATVSAENSVRLMSIHQSKGLEFPVVVVADLGKRFNLSDLRAEIILDEEFGLCPQIKPPHSGQRYPSLAHWLAGRHQRHELLGEELRLLYVAMTRARDRLILSAGIPASQFEKRWRAGGQTDVLTLSFAQSYSDWLGSWFAENFSPDMNAKRQGSNSLLQWSIHDDSRLTMNPPSPIVTEVEPDSDPRIWDDLSKRLTWQYPFDAATQTPAKASVTSLRRQALDRQMREELEGNVSAKGFRGRPAEAGAQAGIAHHKFLQLVSLDCVGTAGELEREAKRLVTGNKLTPDEVELLDFSGLASFWESALGRQVRSQERYLRRELVFTARFTPAELVVVTGEEMGGKLQDEFVVVQGVVDLALITPTEILVVDFKTDQSDEQELKVKEYQRQLRLYALALTRIYQRPVTGCWLYYLALRRAVQVEIGCAR